MPGVVFLVVIPTTNYERSLPNPSNYTLPPNITPDEVSAAAAAGVSANPTNPPAPVRLEVELRAKKTPPGVALSSAASGPQFRQGENRRHVIAPPPTYEQQQLLQQQQQQTKLTMEELLQQLLLKLDIQHVTWHTARGGNHFHVVFPLQAGDACETTLHCLTELRIGRARGTSVSVLPCSVNYDGLSSLADAEDAEDLSNDELTRWNCFVDSIKSKLTVKQVVDGVRSGGALSFDYLLLIVTADSLAALGLVENNAPNITAAMLVSPLMGPVMSITFGAIISDLELVKTGFISLSLGMLISLVFGLIFGLILGSTEMPWGFGDWPTDEMKGRGNSRSLWMGVLWALTSGTGVAVALLQGAVGPLIGVAISASLLPPVVNCGLYWSLSCTWLLKSSGNGTVPGSKIPHLKGEPYVYAASANATRLSAYEPLYSDYMPVEFFVNGICSAMLTVINVCCIFITAIIVLKIKEVAAPYTASPDLRRFWETDIRTVRRTNRSTLRRRSTRNRDDPLELRRTAAKNLVYDKPLGKLADGAAEGGAGPDDQMVEALQQALKQLADDATYRKVRRMSYSGHQVDEASNSPIGSLRNSAGLAHDLSALEQILASMTQRQVRSVVEPNASSALRRTNSAARVMPTIMEKIAARSNSLSRSGGGSRRSGAGMGESSEQLVNLRQNVLD